MKTSLPVQTLETPTQAIRSPSEGTDRSWGLFHLGARPSTPPGIWFSQKPPSIRNPVPRAVSVPFRLCRSSRGSRFPAAPIDEAQAAASCPRRRRPGALAAWLTPDVVKVEQIKFVG